MNAEFNIVLNARQQSVAICKPCAAPELCGQCAPSPRAHTGRQTPVPELLRPHAARCPLHPGGLAETCPGEGANPGAAVRNMGFLSTKKFLVFLLFSFVQTI